MADTLFMKRLSCRRMDTFSGMPVSCNDRFRLSGTFRAHGVTFMCPQQKEEILVNQVLISNADVWPTRDKTLKHGVELFVSALEGKFSESMKIKVTTPKVQTLKHTLRNTHNSYYIKCLYFFYKVHLFFNCYFFNKVYAFFLIKCIYFYLYII